MFKDILKKYYKCKNAEYALEEAFRNLPMIRCPYCKHHVTFNHDDREGMYWMSCTMCGLSTSHSPDLCVITYQWTQISKLHQKPVQEISPEEDTTEQPNESNEPDLDI